MVRLIHINNIIMCIIIIIIIIECTYCFTTYMCVRTHTHTYHTYVPNYTTCYNNRYTYA